MRNCLQALYGVIVLNHDDFSVITSKAYYADSQEEAEITFDEDTFGAYSNELILIKEFKSGTYGFIAGGNK